jgi:hypothetical protein
MACFETPPDWGNDEITKFIDAAQANSHAIFFRLKPVFQKLIDIDSSFRKFLGSLDHTEHWFPSLFGFRSHSNFLAAVRLSISGQVPETYLSLRSSLENALYGYRISKDQSLAETWRQRHNGKQQNTKIREAFKPGLLFRTLAAADADEAKTARLLYDRCIDYGAHPNKRALVQMLKTIRADGMIRFDTEYLGEDSLPLRLALKSTAQIGVCVLGIFRLIYTERFDLIGLTEVIDQLRKDVWARETTIATRL